MPANIVHMLTAHKAIQKLKEKGIEEFTQFATMLDDTSARNCRAYLNLGSVGPDLYYYVKRWKLMKDLLIDKFVQAKGVTPWSYHLHSHQPNVFPLKLLEIMFSDVTRKNGEIKLEDDDIRKLAYIAGHLTHIAADQIIHPVVNSVAGPYYRNGENRREHRECEVFQDYFLYQEVYREEGKFGATYNFLEQKFHKWVDCVKRATFKNSEDWFRYFLQRGFTETYGSSPSEEIIENSADNLLLILRICLMRGPYKEAAEDYRRNGCDKGMCKKYIKDVDYLNHWQVAVELSVIYLQALYEVYLVLKKGQDFTDRHKQRFLKIVSDADLSCPLKKNIFENAKSALEEKKHSMAMVANTP
jgi:hypothetical protein